MGKRCPVASSMMNSFVCSECDKIFTTRNKLDSHKKTHTRKKCQTNEKGHVRQKYLRNDIGNSSFIKTDHLKKHMPHCERKTQSLKCEFCGQVFRHESQRQRHEAVHVTDSHVKGELNSTFSYSLLEQSRELVQEPKLDKTVICPVCGTCLSDNRRLNTHLKFCVRTNYSNIDTESKDGDSALELPPSLEQTKPNSSLKFKVKAKDRNDKKLVKKSAKELANAKSKTCEVCGKAFARSANVLLHMRLHRGEKPFTCTTCGKKFRRSDHLKNHELVHIRKEPYQCNLCSETFKRKDHLKYHHINSHGAKIYLNELKSYTRTAQSEVQNKFILCDICGVSFGSERKLKNHLRIHSNEGKFSCQYCGKTFNQSSNLNIHLRKHTGETPYKCFTCDQSFTTSSKLKTHARKHTGDLPFTCEVCGRLFGENHLLKVHMRIHNNQKPYKCSHCSKTFTHNSTLRAHVRTHTGAKPYKCDQCGDAFAQISSLTYHKRTHSGEKPFSCHICGNSYTRMATLSIHLTRHTGQKRVSCPHCDFKCDTPKHLRKHADKVHSHLKDTVELLLKQNNCQTSDVLYADGTVNSNANSKPSDSAHTSDLQVTEIQPVDQTQRPSYESSSSWNNDNSMNKSGELINSYTDNSVVSDHIAPAAMPNLATSNINQGKPSTSTALTMYNLTNMPYVNGLIVGFPDLPKYTDTNMLTLASLDPTQQQQNMPAPTSYLTLLHNPTSYLGLNQPGFDSSAYCVNSSSTPPEMSSSSSSIYIKTCAQITSYPGQMVIEHNPTFPEDSHYSASNSNLLSIQSQPCLTESQQNLDLSQQVQLRVLAETLPTTCELESHTNAGSYLQSMQVQHPENRKEMEMQNEQVSQEKSTFIEVNCNDSGKKENVSLKNRTNAKDDIDSEEPEGEVNKEEEDDTGEGKTNIREVVPFNSTFKTKSKNVLKNTGVIQSKIEVSDSEQTSNNHEPKFTRTDKKMNKFHMTKLKSKICPYSKCAQKSRDAAKLIKKQSKRKKGPVKCDVCGQTFSRTGNLTTHMRLHNGERPYSCKVCDKRFTRSDHLKTHMLLHKGDNSLVCNHCGDVFSNIDQLNTHTVDRHEGKNPFACNLCRFSCIYIRELKDHVKSHEEKVSFHCDVCDISFIKAKHLKKHMESHDGQSPFICHTCEKSFKESSCLKLHMMTKHTGEKHFKCGVCGETYVTAAKLQRHMRNHSGARPYACEFCGKMFIDTCLLKMHVRIHTNEKPYKCEHCEQSFTHRSTLRAHVRIHTGTKPYTCEVCSASFAQVSSLTYHKRRHDGIKPYTCHVCGNSYTRSTTLSIHMTRHTGQKRMTCPHCVFKCDTPKHLRKHLEKVHSFAGQVKAQVHETKQQEVISSGDQHQQEQQQQREVLPENFQTEQQIQLQQHQPLKQLQPQQQLTASQILFLPQLQHQFQQSFVVARPLQQPQYHELQHVLIHHQQSKGHLTIQPVQPVPLVQHQQLQQPQEHVYETTSEVLRSMIAGNSTEFVERHVICTPSTSVNHTY